ncbi:carboxypeptidase regulatory-like domain-containing protein, partial [Candidatus Micrarchaeota archaeon]|nr:carboxypeptidase regulatory-like domain-containing protein [Candidatus Micrarchaeota archaeon]
MGVVDFFKKIYFKIEDQYYAFCDAVEKTGIKIYEWFVNPIEKRGIPSFPVFALLSLLLLAGIVFLALGGLGSIFQSTNNISISLSSDGLPVEGVSGRLLVDGLDSAFTATSNSQGVLLFEGVPADKKATLRISDPNYEPLIQTISTSSTSLSLSLSPLGGGKKFTVIVVNQDDDPVSKALVSYTDSNGQLVSEFTDAQGRISVGYSRQDQLFYFKASKDGFSRESKTCSPGQNTCLIQLVHSDDSTTKAKKASVLVSVEDENGNPIEARVSLYNSFSDSKIDEANLEYGEAFFEEVVEEGTSVYVNIYPVDESFAPYLGGASGDEKITSAAFNTVFNIVLQRKTSVIPKTDFSKLGIIVSDADGAKIEGATISLYLQNEERILIDEQFTSSDGKAVFDTIQGSTYYVTAFAEGFLPLLEKGLIGGAERQYKLTKLLPGNHGDLEVEVLDADENPVEFAQVKLAYTDGFPLGMPVFETGADGKVLIEGVPLQNIKALVTKGALNGESDAIQVTISENKLVAHLERGFGTIRVRTRDASEAKRVLIAASIDAFVDEEKIVSCNTLSTGDGYCELKVWANNPIVLKANAGGFVATESEEIIVGINQKTDKELLMIPTALSDEIKVLSFEIQNAETNEVLPDGALLEKGGLYKVLITANIPQAEKGGISLRLGDKTSIQDEKAFLLDFDKPSDAKNSWGTIFDQEQACSALETRQESSEVKWLTNEFKTTGVRTLGTFLRVRASATKLDKINFYYRAFVSKNNIWGRDPVDDELGRSENTLEKESCFANTYSKSFGVVEGKGLCNDRGCLYVELSSSEQTVTNGLKVTLGGLFSVNSFVTSFQDPVNPKIIVSSLAKANVLDLEGAQSSTKDLQFSLRKAQSSVSGNTFLPTSNARLKIEYADDSGTILSTERYLSIEGTGVMSLVATPTDFETNVRKDLTITLRDDRGNAITDARVEIEDLEGSPLGGSVSGPLFILGDDSSDRGEDGLYKFRKLNPTSVGKLLVTAKRDGFATETKELRVFAKDFFDVNPTELTFQACGASGSFNLQSLIDVDVPIQVSTDGNCVALSSGEVKLTRTKPSSQYKVSANADGQCKVAFNSLLPGSGSVTELEALVTVTGCAPIPSKCSSNACGECNENECRSLEEKGFCSR